MAGSGGGAASNRASGSGAVRSTLPLWSTAVLSPLSPFVEIGPVPARDRSSSVPRSVRRRGVRDPGPRAGHSCTTPTDDDAGLAPKYRPRQDEAVPQQDSFPPRAPSRATMGRARPSPRSSAGAEPRPARAAPHAGPDHDAPPTPRDRAQIHAVVPGAAESYLKASPGYDPAPQRTTAWAHVRPHEPGHGDTTARRRAQPHEQRHHHTTPPTAPGPTRPITHHDQPQTAQHARPPATTHHKPPRAPPHHTTTTHQPNSSRNRTDLGTEPNRSR